MGDAARRPNRDWRWWMGCEPYIRALREMMHSATANSNGEVENLLQMCVSLYMAAIHTTSSLEDERIYIALSGGRITTVEASFMWLGGWRPTAALLLVYSLMGVHLEDETRNFGSGFRNLPNASAVLSHRQLTNLTNVQKSTREAERKLSKKLANIQMLICDQDVLAAALTVQVDSSPSSSTSRSPSSSSTSRTPDLRTAIRPRMSRLKKLVLQADQLRLHTLLQLFLVLTPLQVARCAIAAFELAFMMRELGNSTHSRNLRTPHSPIPASSPSPDPILDESSQPPPDALTDNSLQISQPGPHCSSQDYTASAELEPLGDDD